MPKLSVTQLIGVNFSFQHYPFEKVASRGPDALAPYLERDAENA